MPKSKRARVVNLTQVKPKGAELKGTLIESVRACCDEFASVYVFKVHNMRNEKMKVLREDWKPSKFFLGKNKVMGVALGKEPEDEYKENMHKITSRLRGDVGLLFSDKPANEVVSYFNDFSQVEYARGGFKATEEVTIPQGDLDQFPHSMEPGLRKLGLPTELRTGVIHMRDDYTVCKVGQTLTPERADILKRFGHKLAKFHLEVLGYWNDSVWTSLLDDDGAKGADEELEDFDEE